MRGLVCPNNEGLIWFVYQHFSSTSCAKYQSIVSTCNNFIDSTKQGSIK